MCFRIRACAKPSWIASPTGRTSSRPEPSLIVSAERWRYGRKRKSRSFQSFYRAKSRGRDSGRRPFLGAPSRLSSDRTGGSVISTLEEKDSYDVGGAKSDGHGGAESSCQKHSMGGGEVARYMGKYGSKGVSKAVFIGSVPPFLLKTPDNPEGVDNAVFDGIQKAIVADRYMFFTEFFKNFYNTDVFLGKRVSEQAVQAGWNLAAGASATASLACVPTWHEDFRQDLKRVDVPTLVIHGDADRIVPFTASGHRTAKLIKGARLFVVKDGPHCVTWTHVDEVNSQLMNFQGQGAAKQTASAPRKDAVA